MIALTWLGNKEINKTYHQSLIIFSALDLYLGDIAAAKKWLHYPIDTLGNRPPIDMTSTQEDYLQVIEFIDYLRRK